MPKKVKKTKTNEKDVIEKSPLLSKDLSSSLHSTINPDRLDPARFSDLRVEEESPIRIILYVIVVIIIGVGAAFGVRELISKDDTNDNNGNDVVVEDNNNDTNTVIDSNNSPITINTTAKPSGGVSNTPKDASFVTTESFSSIGNETIDSKTVTASKLNYQTYTTFSRTEIAFDGLVADNSQSLPVLGITFNNAENKLTVALGGAKTDPSLQTTSSIADSIVSEIQYDVVNNSFVFILNEDSRYAISAAGNRLIIDIKTQAQFDKDTSAIEDVVVEDTTTEDKPVVTTPTGLNLDNDFSEETQFIVSSVTNDTIEYNEFYYEDTVNYFEIAWGSRNNVGDEFITNSTAELVEENGSFFIDVTIKNLASYKDFGEASQATISADLSAANFLSGKLESFNENTGTAVYRVKLKNKASFRLASETTVSGQTQVLVLQIQDN
ncbi:MAG: hypothetical protein Q9M91_01510 [Candidatus Dojkabacteria bacterium]|nr:hypothetical protein [Candidatus Dojkabacteria bacterium]MDQ7020502.1 hypothetical protein [Candidatus Dojkabacteria bacterium]